MKGLNNLKWIREQTGLSPEGFSDFVGIDNRRWKGWESGRKDLSFKEIKRVARAVDLELVDVVGDKTDLLKDTPLWSKEDDAEILSMVDYGAEAIAEYFGVSEPQISERMRYLYELTGAKKYDGNLKIGDTFYHSGYRFVYIRPTDERAGTFHDIACGVGFEMPFKKLEKVNGHRVKKVFGASFLNKYLPVYLKNRNKRCLGRPVKFDEEGVKTLAQMFQIDVFTLLNWIRDPEGRWL